VRIDDERYWCWMEIVEWWWRVVLKDKGMNVVLGKGEDKGWKDVAGDEDTIVVLGKMG